VKSEESGCPFCGAALAPQACSGGCLGSPEARLGRAALVAVGAALLGAACTNTFVPVPLYGGPPAVDAGMKADTTHDGGAAEK
jgi:hypothetical protein